MYLDYIMSEILLGLFTDTIKTINILLRYRQQVTRNLLTFRCFLMKVSTVSGKVAE